MVLKGYLYTNTYVLLCWIPILRDVVAGIRIWGTWDSLDFTEIALTLRSTTAQQTFSPWTKFSISSCVSFCPPITHALLGRQMPLLWLLGTQNNLRCGGRRRVSTPFVQTNHRFRPDALNLLSFQSCLWKPAVAGAGNTGRHAIEQDRVL